MPQIRQYTQKAVFEIRFPVRPSMLLRGATLSDIWMTESSEVEIEGARFRVVDKAKSTVRTSNLHHVVLDMEGEVDFGSFSAQAVELASSTIEHLQPEKLLRIGLREFHIITGIPTAKARKSMMEAFFKDPAKVSHGGTSNEVSDVGLVLDYKSEPPIQGRVQFGPFVRSANLGMFIFHNIPGMAGLDEGFVFDCDYGEGSPQPAVLESERLMAWLRQASTTSSQRVRAVLESMGID